VLASRHAIHQVVRRSLWPRWRDGGFGQVGSHWHNTRWQVLDRAAQATHLPAAGQQLLGQTAAHITTTYDHY